MILLDTHALVWWVSDHTQLSSKAKKAINNATRQEESIFISCISTWEISMLIQKNRLVLSMDTQSWLQEVSKISAIKFCSIDNDIALKSTILPGKFHKDPADRIIIATARKYSIPLITADEKIIDYKHVKTIW